MHSQKEKTKNKKQSYHCPLPKKIPKSHHHSLLGDRTLLQPPSTICSTCFMIQCPDVPRSHGDLAYTETTEGLRTGGKAFLLVSVSGDVVNWRSRGPGTGTCFGALPQEACFHGPSVSVFAGPSAPRRSIHWLSICSVHHTCSIPGAFRYVRVTPCIIT